MQILKRMRLEERWHYYLWGTSNSMDGCHDDTLEELAVEKGRERSSVAPTQVLEKELRPKLVFEKNCQTLTTYENNYLNATRCSMLSSKSKEGKSSDGSREDSVTSLDRSPQSQSAHQQPIKVKTPMDRVFLLLVAIILHLF